MKKTIYIAASLALATAANGASGIFGTGTVLDNNGTSTLYQTTLLGDTRHQPAGGPTPTQNSTGLGGLDLGTFDSSLGNTLVLNGGGVLTYKNDTDNITGSRVIYSIDGGTESTIALAFNEDNVNSSSGDQRWYSEGSSVDILAGLANGIHNLAVRYEADFTYTGGSGTHNSGPFTATFTSVPEPSTTALLGLGGLALILRRRK